VDEGFLPNFCRGPIVLHVIVVAQFLAVAITALIPPLTHKVFLDVFLVSLFVQWIALTSICVLCVAGPFLNSLPESRALITAYLLLLCVTWLVGEGVLWVLANLAIIDSARPSWYAYFHVQNLTVSAIVNALVLRYLMARHQLQLQTRSVERARAEILRQKIRPHLLFNSMNIIASLTRRAPTRAESAIEDMSDLFRVMLDDDKDLVPIHNEISIARKYLKLERLRLDRRLKVSWSTHGLPRAARTPVLILQLLLEHVVHNAVEQMSDTAVIDVSVSFAEPARLVIELSAPYPEQPPGELMDTTGLENIRLRLNDHYGNRANMQVDTGNGRIFVRISHPAFEEDD
jgi:two-component system sensor histidine kinase AlgZ